MTLTHLFDAAWHYALMGASIGALVGFSLGIVAGMVVAIQEEDPVRLPEICLVVTVILSLIGISIGVLAGLAAF